MNIEVKKVNFYTYKLEQDTDKGQFYSHDDDSVVPYSVLCQCTSALVVKYHVDRLTRWHLLKYK